MSLSNEKEASIRVAAMFVYKNSPNGEFTAQEVIDQARFFFGEKLKPAEIQKSVWLTPAPTSGRLRYVGGAYPTA